MGECFKFGRGKLKTFDPVFANNSWEDIIAACQAGKVPATWKVGDQKNMTINGTDYPIDVIGINHDTYSTGGTAPLTFQMHDCYKTNYQMNSVASEGGWEVCNMRKSRLPAILNLMPTEVSAAVREVSKKSGAGSPTIKNTVDKLFLLAEVEIFGKCTYSVPGEGEQYAYYSSGNSTIKKRSGSAAYWWERSSLDYGGAFCMVATNGYVSFDDDTDSYSVAFAFCF